MSENNVLSHVENANTSSRSLMDRLLRPQSIAIVGASTDQRSLSRWIITNLRSFNCPAKLHFVSRTKTEIDGYPCVASVDDLPMGVDVVMLSIPEAGILDAIKACGRRGVGTAVIFSSGFAETGEEGKIKQAAIAKAAKEGKVALVGPNCLGLTNYLANTPLAMDPSQYYAPDADKGVAIIAQSGATANNMRDAAIGRRLSLAYSISTGNEADLGIEDFLEEVIKDDKVGVISIYAEQIRRPKKFIELAAKARLADKAIVLLMPGRSERGRLAAQSHTGALTGDRAVTKTLLQQQGVAFVDTLDELFDVTAILLEYPNPPAQGPAFMTNSGAMKNLALDLADEVNLPFPDLGQATKDKINAMLPDFADAENPLDYTTMGGSNPGAIGEFATMLVEDDAIGGLIVSIMGGSYHLQMDKAKHIVPAMGLSKKPTALAIMGDNVPLHDDFLNAVKEAGVPFFRSPDRAIRAMKRVLERGEALARFKNDNGKIQPAPVLANKNTLAEYEGKQWLKELGLTIPAGGLAKTAEEAAKIGAEIGFPVVVKAQHKDLMHKSDVGGVLVGIKNEAEAKEAFDKIIANVKSHKPNMVLDGVLVEGMAEKGLELVVGASRDEEWGAVTLVGLGGIWIEALGDVRILPPDASEEFILEELQKLRAAVMLKGIRGAPAVNEKEIAKVVARIGAAMIANPHIKEIDINPLVAYPDRVVALDALIIGNS